MKRRSIVITLGLAMALSAWLPYAGLRAAASVRAADPCATSGVTITCTYTYTGGEQTVAVPAGVSTLQVSANGGDGASSPTATGGSGAAVNARIPVPSGITTLYVEVGGNGAGAAPGNPVPPSFNGGGSGGASGENSGRRFYPDGGSGGGASDIRTCSLSDTAGGSCTTCPTSGTSCATPDSRLLVAGGGGGASSCCAGGSAGQTDMSGLGGVSTGATTAGGAGGGAAASAPGAGGTGGQQSGGNGGSGAAGTSTAGGDGGHGGSSSQLLVEGTGGGGGYFGGGGGGGGGASADGAGGGVGSSYVDPSGTLTGISQDTTGTPEVVVSFTNPDAVSISPGWNLIDVPVQADGTNLLGTAAGVTTSIDAALGGSTPPAWALATYGNGQFNLYVPGFSPGVTLQPAQGIFILSSAQGTWTPTGSAFTTTPSVNLAPGWNLVAAPPPSAGLTASAFATGVDPACTSGPCNVTEIATFSGGSYSIWMPASGMSDIPIVSTGGFWVKVSGAATWS